MKRGFWMHQFVEYVLGIGAIAAGAQSPDPVWPCVAGALVLLNAASTHGPLGAFRLVPRRAHRAVDVLLVAALAVAAVLVGMDVNSRVMLVAVAAILAFLVWQTDFTSRPARAGAPGGARSEDVGRTAGRLAGNAVNAWRRRKG